MYHHVAWYEWVLWAIEVCLLFLTWVRSWVPGQRQLMGYLLLVNLVNFIMVWGEQWAYSYAYHYGLVIEDLLIAAAAIDTCVMAFPRYKSLFYWFGPITMAVPAFFILLLERKVTAMEPAMLLATVAIGGSFVLVGGCLLFDSHNRLCWGFLLFLACLLAGAQLHLRYGYTTMGRLAPEIGQVLGLSCLFGTWMLGGVVAGGGRPIKPNSHLERQTQYQDHEDK